MNEEGILIFVDGSVNKKNGVCAAARLEIKGNKLAAKDKFEAWASSLEPITKIFSSEMTPSQCELSAVIWALENCTNGQVLVFTDCQNVVKLPGRRNKLEACDFQNKRGEKLKNADLYRVFFQKMDETSCVFKKVRGHLKKKEMTVYERVFKEVDKASRRATKNPE